MSKIWKLFVNENIKTWKKLSTKILLIVILLALIGTLGFVKLMQNETQIRQHYQTFMPGYIAKTYQAENEIKKLLD